MIENIAAIIAALASAGIGAGLMKLIPMFSQWMRDRTEGRIHQETTLSELQRIDRQSVVENYEKFIERLNKEHNQSSDLWNAERASLIKEKERVNDEVRNLLVENARMQDALMNYQGVGAEATERMDPVLVTNSRGIIFWANAPASTFLGHPLSSMIGKPISYVIPKGKDSILLNKLSKMTEQLLNSPFGVCLVHHHKGSVVRRDGTIINVCFVMNAFRLFEKVVLVSESGKHPDEEISIVAFRLHLRQRWALESDDPPNVSLNSTDDSPSVSLPADPNQENQNS